MRFGILAKETKMPQVETDSPAIFRFPRLKKADEHLFYPPEGSNLTPLDLEEQLQKDVSQFTHDPLDFVNYTYPWGVGDLSDSPGPRPWQRRVLRAIRKHLKRPSTRFQPLLIAVSSGKGIGKSSLLGMIINWGLSTVEDCKIIITANTATQLDTKTVPEVTKWMRMAINTHWWDTRATSIASRERGHDKTWRADFIPWSDNNPEAFAGLHNKGKRIIVIFDEASAISDKIWEVTEGALTDENTEIIWLAFANPTQNTGRFRECFDKFKHRWISFQIDSRTVDGTNKEQIQKWADDYGEDSDFFRVWVKGEFPRVGFNQLISAEAVDKCKKFKAVGYQELPKILSIDVARFGDDQTIIGYRQGRKVVILGKYRGLDIVQTAEKAIHFIQKEEPDATVVDADGLGAGVFDTLKHRGFGKRLFEFHGGETPNNPQMYFNKRAEVWGTMGEALKAGMELPPDPELASDLTGPMYTFTSKQQVQLEKKDDMKKRGLSSPDLGDMLAMTFAVRVVPRPKQEPQVRYIYPSQSDNGWMG